VRIVGIETATGVTSVALGEGSSVVASAARADRRGHVGFLVPALDFCFAQAGWRPGEIDLVAVDVGPGLFGGIRVGLATAQALAGAVGAPLAPVCSLDAVAFQAATAHRRIWAIVDARRGEVAVAPYRPVPGGVVRDGPIELVRVEAVRGLLEGDPDPKLVVGDWGVLPEEALLGVSGVRTGGPRHPSAAGVMEVGRGLAERGGLPQPDEVRPFYLRDPDVRINWSDFRQEGPWPG
jgi:tRNA threonylcarbamoyladenosine biosynthesis protein TsaB